MYWRSGERGKLIFKHNWYQQKNPGEVKEGEHRDVKKLKKLSEQEGKIYILQHSPPWGHSYPQSRRQQ